MRNMTITMEKTELHDNHNVAVKYVYDTAKRILNVFNNGKFVRGYMGRVAVQNFNALQ